MPDFGYGDPMTTEQLEHYRKVKKARRSRGLPVFTEQMKFDGGDAHPLLDKRLRDTKTGDTCVVDSVSTCWHDGFYVQAVIRREGTKSHALIFWENLSSESDAVIEGVEKANEKYDLIKN